jgi:uncharacterized HAD superfamily protein
MRIGVDIDGVLYEWERTARYLLRNRYYAGQGYPEALDKVSDSWGYIDAAVGPEAFHWLWSTGAEQGLWRAGHVIKGAMEGMYDLAKDGHDLVIITHRGKAAVNDTMAWLSFMKFKLAGVHILTRQEPKSSVLPHCDVYIDDKPETITDYLENTNAKLVALYQQPWNENHIITENGKMTWGRGRRVASWSHFVKLVREL